MSYYLLITFAALLAAYAKKLTYAAAACGCVVAFSIYKATHIPGLLMLAAFFILGTLASSWHYSVKLKFGVAENNKGRRKISQVMANAGVAFSCSLLIFYYPAHSEVLILMLACSFSSATADTLSSEIGNLYGSRFINILTFKKDIRGLDGVISLEGSLAGIFGSVVIAAIYYGSYGMISHCIIIIIAGTIGNLTDSIVGATVERKQLLGNNEVNFLNTLVAALFGCIFLMAS